MKIISAETRQKISISMKKAHADGRAHNIGQSRWNNLPSYPEKWFMEVIKNEFNDQDYIHEYAFFKYSLDFAWPNKKFCVEIDGEQHYRQTKDGILQQKRDAEKDALLKANGWYEIRIPWSTICLNSKSFISFVKNALDNAKIIDIKDEPWYQHTHRNYFCSNCGKQISYGSHLCIKCLAESRHIDRMKSRPDKLTLAAQLYESNFTAIGKLYNVSANTIIRWCKCYELPSHIAELKNWYRITVLKLPAVQKIKKVHEQKFYIVQQIDLYTNEIISEYSSFKEASDKTGIEFDNISRVCRGLRKTAGGYGWRKIEDH